MNINHTAEYINKNYERKYIKHIAADMNNELKSKTKKKTERNEGKGSKCVVLGDYPYAMPRYILR